MDSNACHVRSAASTAAASRCKDDTSSVVGFTSTPANRPNPGREWGRTAEAKQSERQHSALCKEALEIHHASQMVGRRDGEGAGGGSRGGALGVPVMTKHTWPAEGLSPEDPAGVAAPLASTSLLM